MPKIRPAKRTGVADSLEGPDGTNLCLCPPNFQEAASTPFDTDKTPAMSRQPPSPHSTLSGNTKTGRIMDELEISWPSLSTTAVPFPLDSFAPDGPLLELNGPTAHETGETASNNNAIQQMNMLSYEIRDQVQKRCLADTTTHRQYELYIKDYKQWWEKNEFDLLQQDRTRECIPALPITPAKVVLFLDYTMKRPRRSASGIEIPGTSVGRATIQNTINALERERSRNAHLYPNVEDAKINLRSDDRIRKMEFAAKHNEPFRILLSQVRKATGTSADTYTREQMVEISHSCLTLDKTRIRFTTAVRDRALYLLPLCTAFRGDNIRNLAFSDLFCQMIKILQIDVDKEILCLKILCDNAKHNQSGKVEEQGAIRHRFVELCAVGAVALHLFALFHLAGAGEPYNWTPDFSPAAQSEGYGIYGRREWWHYKLFPGESRSKPMTYTNHANRIHMLHGRAGAVLSKVTHAQRYTAAFVMRNHGADKEATRAMGWSCGDAYNLVYDRQLPIEALLGAAMYNAQKPETYFCARDLLEPPSEITSQIFPWVENELEALRARANANPQAADLALEGFLGLLKILRRVLVQDLAVLYENASDSYIYTCPPFNSQVFQDFAINSSALLEESEQSARLALQNLPMNVARTFEGAIQLLLNKKSEKEDRQAQQLNAISKELTQMRGVMEAHHENPPNKRRKTNSKKAVPLRTNTNENISGNNENSAQPIRSMLTAPTPIIPIAVSYYSQQIDDETADNFGDEGAVTVIPRPNNVIGSLAASYNTVLEAVEASSAPSRTDSSSITLPQLGPASQHHPRETWEPNWIELTNKYKTDKLLTHTWDWEQNHLVPHYDFQKVTTFEELWNEYTEGLNGYLPFREIKERWAANPAWHRNEKARKNEFTRRKKTIELIETLSKRASWTIPKALKFLTEWHSNGRVIGTFMRQLNTTVFTKILADSEEYFG